MNTPFVFKKCSKCGRWLVASTNNFYKLKSGKYGLNSQCKECINTGAKKYYKDHREERRAYKKKYHEKNKEEILEKQKKYREKHKEKILEYQRKYDAEHKDERRKYYKEYLKTTQGQVVEFNRHCRRRKREQQGDGVTKEQWLEMMKFFGFKCAYSGITLNVDNRTIDHIEPLVKGGAHEIWNCVPMDRSLNSSKCDSDIEEWYPQQDFYDEDKLNKINEWRKYSYNKWGKEVNTKAI